MERVAGPHFSIVLPAYNESENIAGVLKNLKLALNQASIFSEIIVVDNGSTDDTPKILNDLKREIGELRVLRIEKNIGCGNGIIKGLDIACGDILCFMDADGQVRSGDLISVYHQLKDNSLDLCKGTRIKRFFNVQREVVSKIYNFLFRILFDSRFQDINGSPKIFTRRFYQEAHLTSKDWFLDAEIMIKAKRGKYAIGDFPIVYLERQGGNSKVSVMTMLEFLKNMFYWKFLLWKK
ncbi:MAG: glycosyltransferase family 2 protein [Candidatus Nealsonbacteria bacterium]|nr:glycosyltransferase family 2 protein [Candidatus Nealsonbacteria bacterium]